MEQLASRPSAVDAWWERHGDRVLGVAIVAMAALAVLKIGSELHRLIFSTARTGAVDLLLRHVEVQWWFAGLPVYTELPRATYPPASYPLLWPFLGWMDVTTARWLWALTSLIALGWLAMIAVRESGATTPRARALIAVMVLSMNAVGVTIGNGQVIVHLLPALLTGVLIVQNERARWLDDALAALLLAFVAIKPSIAAPFVWIVLFTTRRPRPIVIGAVLLVALTVFAASYQPESIPTLLAQWQAQSQVYIGRGYGDVHTLLVRLGLREWAGVASLAMLLGLGIWTWRRRRADVWLLLGVAAIVARFWTYHRVYDDALILLPMIALARVAFRKGADSVHGRRASVLLGVAIAMMLMPARLELAGFPLSWLFIGGHVLLWVVLLVFLVRRARSEGRHSEFGIRHGGG